MHEHEPRPTRSRFAEAFGLSDTETLFNRFGETRLRTLLDQPDIQVHSAQVDSNSYGEFLFITLSREYQGKRQVLTCFSLGYHESRETWIQKGWSFYQSDETTQLLREEVSKAQVQALLEERRAAVAAWAKEVDAPSQRALLFSLLADLTDEDGAYSELEELDDLTQWLDDEPE
jgi:hypothetical protein